MIDLDAIRARWSAPHHDDTMVDALSADEARQCVRDLLADLHAVLLTCTVTDASEPEPVEWSELTPSEVLRAIESAPRVAGPWTRDGDRWDRGVRDTMVAFVEQGSRGWSYDVSMCGDADLDTDVECAGGLASAEAAKAAADAVLRDLGWVLCDEEMTTQ